MKYLGIILGIVGVVLLGMIAFKSPMLGDSGMPNYFNSAVNTYAYCSNSTSSPVISAAGSRQFAYITNASTTFVTVCEAPYCLINQGAVLPVGGSLKIDLSNLYKGAITCIASSSVSSTLGVIYAQ